MLGMISTAKHKREMDMRDRVAVANEQMIQKLYAENNMLKMRLHAQVLQNERLQARLAPFTTPRARNTKGQFTKDAA